MDENNYNWPTGNSDQSQEQGTDYVEVNYKREEAKRPVSGNGGNGRYVHRPNRGQRDGLTFNWLNFVIGAAVLAYFLIKDSWSYSFIIYLAIVVIIHELGHVIAGLSFGCGIKEMKVFFLSFLSYKPKWTRGGTWSNIKWSLGLLPLGGVTVFKSRPEGNYSPTNPASSPFINDKPAWQRLVISVAGVLLNILTFVVVYYLVMPVVQDGANELCWSLAFLSLLLAILNILPVYPLDGGAIIFALYEMLSGRKPSQQFVNICGIVGVILIVFFFWIYPDWINNFLTHVLRSFF